MKKLLVYRTGSLGDSIVTLPALFYLKKKFPKAIFYLLTNKSIQKVNSKKIFEIYNIFNSYIYYSKKKELIKIHKKLKKFNFDAIYNFAPERNFQQKIRDYIYFKTLINNGKYFFDNKFNANIPEYRRLLNICNTDVEISDLLPKNNIKKKNNFVFCCGSKKEQYQWNLENYILIGKYLNKYFPNDKLIFLGDRHDYFKSQKIIEEIKNGVNYCGKLNIKNSLSLLKKTKLYFGEDTGTMHLAGLAYCPVVAFFNYRKPTNKWLPLSKTIQIFPNNKCNYRHDYCEIHNNLCVRSIGVTKTLQGLKKALKELVD